MSRKTSTSAKEIQKAVAAFLATFEEETVPPGYYSTKRLAELHGTGPRNVFIILKRLEKAGQVVDKRSIRVHGPAGIAKVPHYKLTKAAAKAFGLTDKT